MRTAARSNPGPRSAGRRANGLAENAAIAGCELLVMRDHGLVPVSPFPAHQQEGQPGQGASGGSPPRLGNLPAGHRPTTPGQFGQPDCCIRSAGTCPAAGTGGTGRLCPRAVVNRAPAEPIATTRPGNGTGGPGAGPPVLTSVPAAVPGALVDGAAQQRRGGLICTSPRAPTANTCPKTGSAASS